MKESSVELPKLTNILHIRIKFSLLICCPVNQLTNYALVKFMRLLRKTSIKVRRKSLFFTTTLRRNHSNLDLPHFFFFF